MPSNWLYTIGGIIIGLLVFTIALKIIFLSIEQSSKQTALSNYNNLYSDLQSVCFQDINNSMTSEIVIPSSVRVLYTSYDENILDSVYYQIKNKEYSKGDYLCLQFKNEQETRCQKLDCNVNIQYMGALDSGDIQLLVNEILGRSSTKEYNIEIKKNIDSEIDVKMI